jgi:hypothetical protein
VKEVFPARSETLMSLLKSCSGPQYAALFAVGYSRDLVSLHGPLLSVWAVVSMRPSTSMHQYRGLSSSLPASLTAGTSVRVPETLSYLMPCARTYIPEYRNLIYPWEEI